MPSYTLKTHTQLHTKAGHPDTCPEKHPGTCDWHTEIHTDTCLSCGVFPQLCKKASYVYSHYQTGNTMTALRRQHSWHLMFNRHGYRWGRHGLHTSLAENYSTSPRFYKKQGRLNDMKNRKEYIHSCDHYCYISPQIFEFIFFFFFFTVESN